MHILITGAGGFVGAHMVALLLESSAFTRLTLVDMAFPTQYDDARVHFVQGSVADPGVLSAALAQPADVVYHLASIAGGRAERDFGAGLEVNLLATVSLLEGLQAQPFPARLVYSSTIAVFGSMLPALVDDDTPKRPALSYGAHKLCAEILIEDYSRRGWIDGRTLRLPGIVARPPAPAGLLSAFMSEVFWAATTRRAFTSPVSPGATMWIMSAACCARNLQHAAALSREEMHARRDYTLPALRVSMAELVAALTAVHGDFPVTYVPDAALEAAFGSLPLLDAAAAHSCGFVDDGSIEQLVRRATS